MREDAYNVLIVLALLVLAATLWIAAWMDTESGVYPSPSTTVEIGEGMVCDPDCRVAP